MRNQLTIIGTWNSSFTHEEIDDWNYVLDRLKCESIYPDTVITYKIEFDRLLSGFELMRDKKEEYVKVMGIFQ